MEQAVVDRLTSSIVGAGHQVRIDTESEPRVSPLGYKHINTLGRYNFIASQPGEGLRPLRDPSQHEEDEG
uniref:hypothetical protein n=1 Tax=Herbidospora sakaeratensis TaxID=564415 RepID=UPI000781A9F6|nr:hypothetical protein [Herbidospora sakaeratensis]